MNNSALVTRRHFLQLSSLAAAGATVGACRAPSTTLPVEAPVASPDEALQRLMEGNQRYRANQSLPLNESIERRTEVAKGQAPFAAIFSCVDSRVPPELIFDRGLGDLFVIRTAGHVIDNAVLGSLEFGVEELKIPLLLVLGHAKCGAVKATAEAIESAAEIPGHIGYLVTGIKPAVEQAAGLLGDKLTNCINANVELTVKALLTSEILSHAIHQGRLKIVGGRYDLETGAVKLLV